MPTYEVAMEFRNHLFVMVEADDEEQAQEKAEEEFDPAAYMEPIIHGHWEIAGTALFDAGDQEGEA